MPGGVSGGSRETPADWIALMVEISVRRVDNRRNRRNREDQP
jgi:hypothetical protein